MISRAHLNVAFAAIHEISHLNSTFKISVILADAMANFGFTALGVNGLPPPKEGTDPRILSEVVPEGFRELYVHERLYLADHICAHARTTCTPFRYSEAPYDGHQSRGHQRFGQVLKSFDMGRGLIVPVGRPRNIASCVWVVGRDP